MRSERRILFLTFMVCLAAAQMVRADDGFQGRDAGASAGLARIEASTSTAVKVTICHVPKNNPEKARTLRVAQRAVQAHLNHGDTLGACRSAVAKTGQTTCADPNGTSIVCTGTGQDGEFKLGASLSPRFTDPNNGTVKDNLTGLIWLKDANCFGLEEWIDALSDANTLADGSCGLTDGSVAGAWRLPNVKELQSLIDFGRNQRALPTGHPFSGVQSGVYWSSTTLVGDKSFAWSVNLDDGSVDGAVKIGGPTFVWPVRGGN